MDVSLNNGFIISIRFPAAAALASPSDGTWLTCSVSELLCLSYLQTDVSFHSWAVYRFLHWAWPCTLSLPHLGADLHSGQVALPSPSVVLPSPEANMNMLWVSPEYLPSSRCSLLRGPLCNEHILLGG